MYGESDTFSSSSGSDCLRDFNFPDPPSFPPPTVPALGAMPMTTPTTVPVMVMTTPPLPMIREDAECYAANAISQVIEGKKK